LVIVSSISSSVGAGDSASSAAAAIMNPGWQYPHCGTTSSIQAVWTGWSSSPDANPSMVVTSLPSASRTGTEHERTAWPSRCTVHAPHAFSPQPNLVPLSPSSLRITQRSGVSGSISSV